MENLKPEKVQEIFAKNGKEITIEQANEVLELLRKLANIAVTQTLRNEDSKSLHTGEY